MIEKYVDMLWSPIIASLMIGGGIYQILRPNNVLAWNRKFVPARSWDLLVRSGFATRLTYIVFGCIAIVAGVSAWVLVIVRPDLLP
jgi:hypothetical protein